MKIKPLEVIIDWLEFTVLNMSLTDALDIINLDWDQFSPLDKGRFGYNNQIKWSDGNIFIMFSSSDEKPNAETKINMKSGIHVVISGQGCRQYSVHHDLIALINRLSMLPKVNFSRIDLAIDDYSSQIVSYDKINKAAKKGYFTSRWSKWDELTSRQTSTNAYLGRTMYFGSQSSDLFCRIYDKSLERKAKSAETSIPPRWTRLELVYRKERALKLAENIIQGLPIGRALRGTLKQYIRFLIPSPTDKNKSRWKSARWWITLLEDVEKLQLTIKKEPKTIEEMTSWIDQQIAPTMAAILKAQEGDLAWLRSILIKGSKRLSQKHKDAINHYIKEGDELLV